MMKLIIARRPFQVSAKDEKPNLLSNASLKKRNNPTGAPLLLLCQKHQPASQALSLSLMRF
jgi:hypothetical protein